MEWNSGRDVGEGEVGGGERGGVMTVEGKNESTNKMVKRIRNLFSLGRNSRMA